MIMPNNFDAEKIIITVLIIGDIDLELTSDIFFHHSTRKIYEAWEHKQSLAPYEVDKYQLDKELFLNCMEEFVTENQASEALKELKELRARRIRLLEIEEEKKELYDTTKVLNGSLMSEEMTNKVLDSKQLAEKALKLYGDFEPLETRFSDLNHLVRRVLPGNVITIGARCGVGKTGFAYQLLESMCESTGKMGVFFSQEMDEGDFNQRTASVAYYKDCDDNLLVPSIAECERVFDDNCHSVEYLESCNPANILFDSSPRLTPTILKQKIQALKKQYPDLTYVLIDYFQLMVSDKQTGNRATDMSSIAREYRPIAKETGTVILPLSQLKKKDEDEGFNEVYLTDLKESADLADVADSIMMMWKDKKILDHNLKAINAKAWGEIVPNLLWVKDAKPRKSAQKGRVPLAVIGTYYRQATEHEKNKWRQLLGIDVN